MAPCFFPKCASAAPNARLRQYPSSLYANSVALLLLVPATLSKETLHLALVLMITCTYVCI